MTNSSNNEKTMAFLDYFNNTSKQTVEFLVEGLGWLVIMKESIEIVSDNWFASTKYSESTCNTLDLDTPSLICMTNVYMKNATFIDNNNNVKFNLAFDELCVFIDKVVAFY